MSTGAARMLLATAAAAALLPKQAGGKQYSKTYSFLAERSECDGQCTYCRHAHNHEHWAEIRSKIGRYVYWRKEGEPGGAPEDRMAPAGVHHVDIQNMIDYSWERGKTFECVIGVISMRLLSFAYLDPMQFVEESPENFDVLDFLDVFNQHTGALDLLQSAWAALLAGGWPVFRQLLLVGRKVRDRMATPGAYPRLQGRPNECDSLDSAADVGYRDEIRRALREEGSWPLAGTHILALRRGVGCPAGQAVAMLALALDMVRNREMYQGSLKNNENLVYALVSSAQDTVGSWTRSKNNWSPFFDLLTTEWPLWDILSELACVNTKRPCVTRSPWQCYDMVRRQRMPCPHRPPREKRNFASCGEHDICTQESLDVADFCVAFDRRPAEPKEPFLLGLGHDDERRVCAQCGQDGVIRAIFSKIGFRPATRPAAGGLEAVAPYFVEFGARKPGMLNSAALRTFCRWDGLLMDSQPGETPHGGCRDCPGVAELVRKEFVTAENVVELFEKHGVPRDFDLLTVDTDYNDYWLWRAILEDGRFRPRVVAVDFNPDLPLDAAKVVEYEAEAEWDGTRYTVGSLLAYALMARAHGYAFAYALEMGAHAFFIRSDLLAEADLDLPLRSVQKSSHLPDELGRAFRDVLYDYVPVARSAPAALGAAAGVGAPAVAGEAAAPAAGVAATSASSSSSIDSELRALRQQVGDLVAEVQHLRRASPQRS
eukprot:TRINITY_DN8562_c0_g5_i1.p1 TRINITY_DN8562_c0_g5~~TRINITY_DN8562_c0_g5_i1.p1  ORF type:complete len:731 (+),score=133.96 TRINITY_DN8562_c0_g5_i1:56-2194(+)